jgi:hypothetical protein
LNTLRPNALPFGCWRMAITIVRRSCGHHRISNHEHPDSRWWRLHINLLNIGNHLPYASRGVVVAAKSDLKVLQGGDGRLLCAAALSIALVHGGRRGARVTRRSCPGKKNCEQKHTETVESELCVQ